MFGWQSWIGARYQTPRRPAETMATTDSDVSSAFFPGPFQSSSHQTSSKTRSTFSPSILAMSALR